MDKTSKNIVQKRDVELMFEVAAFRYIDRSWKQFLNPDVANNAEHTFRVMWISLTLARYEKDVNHAKLLKMAMSHDLSESRCGDVHYLSRQYVERKENEAVEDIFAGTTHDDMVALMVEYEKRECIEAKLVKDADNLDVEIELAELRSKGHSLGNLLTEGRDRLVFPKLYTEAAKLFWQEIRSTDPHAWHFDSPKNRFRGGDWKPKQ